MFLSRGLGTTPFDKFRDVRGQGILPRSHGGRHRQRTADRSPDRIERIVLPLDERIDHGEQPGGGLLVADGR